MGTKWKVALGVLAGLVVGAGTAWYVSGHRTATVAESEPHSHEDGVYSCSMHPQVVSDEPGNCPICGMRLSKVSEPEPPTGEREILHWRAPMDPNYISDKPGKSPMGMDLIPVYADEVDAGGVRVDPNFVQNFAVRTVRADRGSIPVEVRTVGVLGHNEENVRAVTVKYDGWIESSRRNTIGEMIEAGEPLLEIYSPALVTTQKEYLAARDYARRLEEAGAEAEAVERAASLLDAARQRLRYWDLTDAQIAEIERLGEPRRAITVYAPISGQMMSKAAPALEGLRVASGMTVLTIADHTRLWAEVALYERDLRHVRAGQSATVTAEAFPGRRWRGRVAMFDAALDQRTRTLKAFIEVANPDGRLSPGLYVDVEMRPPAATRAVRVPEEAVIHSGERSVVIVRVGETRFEPREVELGPAGGGFQEIRRGVDEGEDVVVSSQFLIDSESNLKAAVRRLLGDGEAADAPDAAPGGHVH